MGLFWKSEVKKNNVIYWDFSVAVLQSSGEWLYLESVCETEAVFIWSNESLLDLPAGFALALQYEDQLMDGAVSHMPLTNTEGTITVHGLSPGHVYHFYLLLTRPSGATQTYGSIFICNTSTSLHHTTNQTNIWPQIKLG